MAGARSQHGCSASGLFALVDGPRNSECGTLGRQAIGHDRRGLAMPPQRFSEDLRRNGEVAPDAPLAHTSPVGWEHIAFSGDFLWDRAAKTTARKALVLPAAKAAAS